MPTRPFRSLPTLALSQSKRGFALIIVLIFLSLCTILLVGLLITVKNDGKIAKVVSSGSSAHQLADATVQIVMAQIQQATSGGPTYTWASQPGMIRTYDNNGAEQVNYKLYSSGTMTTTGPLTVASTASATGNNVNDYDPAWASNSALWTDLNSPVADDSGTLNYPIINPGAVGTVQGFSINSAPTMGTTNPAPMPVQWLYQLKDGTLVGAKANGTNTVTVNGATSSNPIVGRIAFWTDDETCKVNINTAGEGNYWDTPRFYGNSNNSTALASSPSTVNTTLMDPTNLEMQYAVNQPAQYEFQRYPGHPAQVALSPILPKLANLALPGTTTSMQTVSNTMAGVTPFLAAGGSIGGTVRPAGPITLSGSNIKRPALYASIDELLFSTANTSPRTVTQDSNANALLSKTDLEKARFFITANSRAPELNLFGQPRIAAWPINTDLAIHANSPYTTVYDRLVAFCSTIGANLSSSQKQLYYFQRQKFNDTTFDYSGIPRNVQLYTYLQNLTSQNIPGFGGNFQSKFTAPERDQILTEIFDYIRCTDDFDVNLGPAPGGVMPPTAQYASTQYQFARYQVYGSGSSSFGQITPIQITTNNGITKGFGRFPTLSEVAVLFICCADGSLPASTTAATNSEAACLASNMAAAGVYPTSAQSNSAWKTGINSFMTLNGLTFSSFYNPAFTTSATPAGNLSPTQKMYQMALLFKTFCPSHGLQAIYPDYIIQVSGNGKTLDQAISITGANPTNPFPSAPYATYYCNKIGSGESAPGNNGGIQGTWGPFWQTYAHIDPFGYHTSDKGNPIYPFISKPFIIDTSTTNKIQFTNDVQLQIKIFQGLYSYDNNQSAAFPSYPLSSSFSNQTTTTDGVTSPAPTVQTVISNQANLVQTFNVTLPAKSFPLPTLATGQVPPSLSPQNTGSENLTIPLCWYIPARSISVGRYVPYGDSGTQPPSPPWSDVVRSVSIYNGDARLVAATPVVDSFNTPPPSIFLPHPNYADGITPFADYLRNFEFSHSSAKAEQFPTDTGNTTITLQGKLVNVNYSGSFRPRSPDVPHFLLNSPGQILSDPALAHGPAYTMDWDNSIVGETQDGAYINKADDGDFQNLNSAGFDLPYFNYGFNSITNAATFLTPNRLVPSPGMFGSLPTGVIRNQAWQTLLFRPSMQASGKLHPDAAVPTVQAAYNQYTAPPDHLIMDLFWVPIVEPYAISDPFSTAGKINMNYQIAPFTYLDRFTSLVCLMKSEKLIAVPTTDSLTYKNYNNTHQYRLPLDLANTSIANINENGTLRQFKARFAAGDLFRSATEICDIFLMPIKDALGSVQNWTSDADAVSFWSKNLMTGDNMREKPYTNLYGRLTTKSNTYTVHFRVQKLQKVPSTPANEWVDGTDVINSEYRGSSLIERYLDVDDSTIPDFAANPSSTANLDTYYKFHILSIKRFSP